jgi:hypothetical protein
MRHDYPIAAIPHDTPRGPFGPTVPPGNYTVRLTVDGKSLTAPLTIKMDPRINTPPADLQKKFRAETHLASTLTTTTQALREGGSARTQLENLQTGANARAKQAAAEFQQKLNAVLGAPGDGLAAPASEVTLARVNAEVSTLYGEIWQADAEPTSAQAEAIAGIDRDSGDALKRWDALKKTELPALNRLLRESQAPEINIHADLQRVGTEMEDEE